MILLWEWNIVYGTQDSYCSHTCIKNFYIYSIISALQYWSEGAKFVVHELINEFDTVQVALCIADAIAWPSTHKQIC